MRPFMKVVASFTLVSALGLIAYPLYAHCGKCAASAKTIVTQLDASKMSLAKAVTVAEEHSKGRAISVLSDVGDKGEVAVNVFCLSNDKIQKCLVDLKTGRVTEMKEVSEFPISGADHAHDDKHGAAAAGEATNKMITNRETDVGCGNCVYHMKGVEGCPLAVTLDGKTYLVEGATWPNHDYCDARQQAVVTGKLEGDKFIATSVTAKK